MLFPGDASVPLSVPEAAADGPPREARRAARVARPFAWGRVRAEVEVWRRVRLDGAGASSSSEEDEAGGGGAFLGAGRFRLRLRLRGGLGGTRWIQSRSAGGPKTCEDRRSLGREMAALTSDQPVCVRLCVIADRLYALRERARDRVSTRRVLRGMRVRTQSARSSSSFMSCLSLYGFWNCHSVRRCMESSF